MLLTKPIKNYLNVSIRYQPLKKLKLACWLSEQQNIKNPMWEKRTRKFLGKKKKKNV